MWIRGSRIIWIKIHTDGTKPFRLNLPVSLYTLKELSQCLADIMDLVYFFIPKHLLPHSSAGQWVKAAKEAAESADILLQSFMDQKACNLVEVNAGNVNVSIKIL